MTYDTQSTPIPGPWDVMSAYATSFGLFAPGTLMAVRLAAATPQTQPSPSAQTSSSEG